jgi:hypothetical protein
MSWTKAGFILVLVVVCGFSFAAGGLTVWLAGPPGGQDVYRIGKTSYGRDGIDEEFDITLRMGSQFTPAQRVRLATNATFRSIWLHNRFLSDVLVADAEKVGWLENPDCRAWMRLAVREAIRQFILVQHLSNVSVTSNEVITWYDAHANSLQQLPFDEALEYARERVMLDKRQAALVVRAQKSAKKLGAVLLQSNF